MKLAIAQLRKLRLPYTYEEELDLSQELVGFEDILSTGPAKVKSVLTEVSHDRYLVSMDIDINLSVRSAISLKPIEITISTNAEEIYTQFPISEDDDVNVIEKQTLDTKDAVVTAILCEKPMRTIGDDEEYVSNEQDDQEEEKINPAFASLKDLLK